MNKNFISEDVERWEDIPKAKISDYKKRENISSQFSTQSAIMDNDWSGINNKSIRILKNLYDTNLKKVNDNIDRTPHKDLFEIVCDKEILRLAYRKLSKNKGATTPGAVDITTTHINDKFLENLSLELKEEKFKWNPAKRIYVEKPGKKVKKKRPLGINDTKNKIVQEALRLVLEAIYEPEFIKYETNSGFRPKRDCANAIENIKKKAQFANIVIEGDIVGAFDAIDHNILFNIIKERIKDNKFLKLLQNSFKAGIIEERTFINTDLGVPQGGICSPILFNIYMHEFDKFMIDTLPKIIEDEDINSQKTKSIKENSEYKKYRNRRKKCEDDIKYESERINIIDKDIKTLFEAIRENNEIFSEPIWSDIMSRGKKFDKRIYKNATKDATVNIIKEEIANNSNLIQKNTLLNYKINRLSEEIKMINLKLKSTPRSSIENSKVLMYYHRYADDWTLWLRSTEDFAINIKEKIKTFLKEKLIMELSELKTKVTILEDNQAKFLGFSIYKNKNVRTKIRKFSDPQITNPTNRKITTRISNLRVDLDRDRLNERFKTRGFFEIIKYFDRKDMIRPREIGWLTIFEIQQIIEKFNQFMLGFGNYYITVISEPSRICRYIYILYYSCLKTLCCKLRISTKKLTELYGYYDISDQFSSDYKMNNNDRKEDYLHTDIRICYKYKFNNEDKWIVLLNYKEIMSKLLQYRKKFRDCFNNNILLLTQNIDYFSMYKLNFRTRYKMVSHCIICGSNETPLHNHHIKKLSHSGNKNLKGYKSFDKLVASLNRKQITICATCHDNIHKGIYNGLKLTDLYDVRLAIPENYINIKAENDFFQDRKSMSEKDKDTIKFIVNEENRTYWNKDYHEYLFIKGINFKDMA